MHATPFDASCIFEADGDALQLSRLPYSQPPVTRDASQPEFIEPSICHEPILVAESAQRRVWSRRQPCTVSPWEATGGADRASTRKVGTVRGPLENARAASDQAPRLIFRRVRLSRFAGLDRRFGMYFWLYPADAILQI